MGNCSCTKRKYHHHIPVPTRKGSSGNIKRIFLDQSKKEGVSFKRSLSKEEIDTTSKIISLNNDPTKNKNKEDNESSIISNCKKPKGIIIRLNDKDISNNNSTIKAKSKEKKSVNLIFNNSLNNSVNKSINNIKLKQNHIKNKPSSSRFETISLNTSITNNYNTAQIKNQNNLKIYLPENVAKTSSKCKNKISRGTIDSNNSNISLPNTRNYKIKQNNYYYKTYNEINDENINTLNIKLFNIYDNENINNVSKNYDNNKTTYKCIKTIVGHQEKIVSMIELSNGGIATGSYDCNIKIWDIEKGICIKSIKENGYIFSLLEMEPNMLLSATNKNSIQLFNLNSSNNENIFSFKGHS